MKQPSGQTEANWRHGAATVLGLAGLLVWLLQLGEVIPFRTGFLCTLLVLPLLALYLPREGAAARVLPETRSQGALLVFVIGVAILTRTIALDQFPPSDAQLWEETQTGKVAYDSLRYGSLDPYFPLTNLAGELGFRLFGVSMYALRLPFVGLGIAAVPLFFVACRFFLRTFTAALVTTAFFAVSSYLSSASRVALETMAPIFTVCLALALTFRACVRRSPSAFALAGIANGLLMLEYFSYKLLPPLLTLCLVAYVLQDGATAFANRPGGSYRFRRLLEYRGRLFLYLAFGCAVAVPVVLLDPPNSLDFFLEGVFRQQVGIEHAGAGLSVSARLRLAADRIAESTTFLFWRGGQSDIVASSRGVIDIPTGLIGCASLLYCAAFGLRCPGKLFLFGTIAIFVVLSGALVGNPSRYRLTALTPLYLLAIGVALDDSMHWFQARRRRMAVLALAVLALSFWNLRSLAVDVLRHPSTRAELYDLPLVIVSEIARLQRRDPEVRIHLVSGFVYLGGVSDYEFLYDPERVEVWPSASELHGARGYVLAHDEFMAGVRELPWTWDCHAWRSSVPRHKLLRCRLGDRSAPSTGEE